MEPLPQGRKALGEAGGAKQGNKEPHDDPENPTPQPTSHTESIPRQQSVSLVPSHWTGQDSAIEPRSGS